MTESDLIKKSELPTDHGYFKLIELNPSDWIVKRK